MWKFIVKRILYVIPTILISLSIVFILMKLLPGSPVYGMVDFDEMTMEEIEAIEDELGLNDPLIVQYLRYVGDVLTGNWGNSYFNERPVFTNIAMVLEPTIMITIMSTLITVCVGIPIGIICATKRNSFLDYMLSSTSVVFMAVPAFWLGILLVYFFAFKLGWFPIEGYRSLERYGLLECLRSILLPSIAMSMSRTAAMARQTRSAMLNVLNADYIRTARAKGLRERVVNYKHALKNTLSLVATLVGAAIGEFLGGSTVIERVFNVQGVGNMAHSSLMRLDYYQTQAIILFSMLIYIVINIILDIVYKMLDPRIDY